MKRDYIDFHWVADEHLAIHRRLLNWERWVRVRAGTNQAPIWRLGKSNTRQWHSPEVKEHTDILDGMAMEKAVTKLPPSHRDAIRWCYVWQTTPTQARRKLGVTNEGLQKLIHDARTMLVNRSAK